MAATEYRLDITGTEDFIDRLHKFSDYMQKKAARAAARKSMVVVRDAARANAKALDDPITPNMIWKNIVINESQRGGRRIGGIVMRVGVRGGAIAYQLKPKTGGVKGFRHVEGKAPLLVQETKTAVTHPGGDTRYWRFLELGTRRSRVRAFMLPALMMHTGDVVNDFIKEMNVQIDKVVGPHQPV